MWLPSEMSGSGRGPSGKKGLQEEGPAGAKARRALISEDQLGNKICEHSLTHGCLKVYVFFKCKWNKANNHHLKGNSQD